MKLMLIDTTLTWGYYLCLQIYFVLQSDTTYFSSSDWLALHFLLTNVTNVL